MNKDIKHGAVSTPNLSSLGSKDAEVVGRASTPEGAASGVIPAEAEWDNEVEQSPGDAHWSPGTVGLDDLSSPMTSSIFISEFLILKWR